MKKLAKKEKEEPKKAEIPKETPKPVKKEWTKEQDKELLESFDFSTMNQLREMFKPFEDQEISERWVFLKQQGEQT